MARVKKEDTKPYPPIGREVVTQEGCRRTVTEHLRTGDERPGWVDEHGEWWPNSAVYRVVKP